MSRLYQIIRFDKFRNKEILGVGITKGIAEEALRYDEKDPSKVHWNNEPIVRSDPRSGNVLIYEGEYKE